MFVHPTIKKIIKSIKQDSQYWYYDDGAVKLINDINKIEIEFSSTKFTNIYMFTINKESVIGSFNNLSLWFLQNSCRKLAKNKSKEKLKTDFEIYIKSENPERFI